MEACWHCKRHYNKCSFLSVHNAYIYGNSWHHKTDFALKLEKPQWEANLCLVNAYSWMSLYTSCFVMFFVFLYGPSCHSAHKLDLSTLQHFFFEHLFHLYSPGWFPFIYLLFVLNNFCDLLRFYFEWNGKTKLFITYVLTWVL